MTSSSSARTVAEANPKMQSPATSRLTPRFFIARPLLSVSGCGLQVAGCRRVLRPKAAPNSDTYAPFTHNLLFPKGRVPPPPPFTLKTWKRSALHVVGRRDAGDGFGNSRLSLLPRTDRRAATSCPRYPEDSELAPPPTHRSPRAGASRGRRWGDYVRRARTIDLFAVESKSENTAGRHGRTQHERLPGRGHSKDPPRRRQSV